MPSASWDVCLQSKRKKTKVWLKVIWASNGIGGYQKSSSGWRLFSKHEFNSTGEKLKALKGCGLTARSCGENMELKKIEAEENTFTQEELWCVVKSAPVRRKQIWKCLNSQNPSVITHRYFRSAGGFLEKFWEWGGNEKLYNISATMQEWAFQSMHPSGMSTRFCMASPEAVQRKCCTAPQHPLQSELTAGKSKNTCLYTYRAWIVHTEHEFSLYGFTRPPTPLILCRPATFAPHL